MKSKCTAVVLDADRNQLLTDLAASLDETCEKVVRLSVRHNPDGASYELSKLGRAAFRAGERIAVVIPGALPWYQQIRRNLSVIPGAYDLYFINSAPLPSMRGHTFRLCRDHEFTPTIKDWHEYENWDGRYETMRSAVWRAATGEEHAPFRVATTSDTLVVGQLPTDKTLGTDEHGLNAMHEYLVANAREGDGRVYFKPHPADQRADSKAIPHGAMPIDRHLPFAKVIREQEFLFSTSISSMACVESWAGGVEHYWMHDKCEAAPAMELACSLFRNDNTALAASVISDGGWKVRFEDALAAWQTTPDIPVYHGV